ncbi:MAG TPA: CU044_2847 family protein [Ktedonobacteraceae bacterium]|nr:CU044_2847 family protein [Ktedonobacteraceae bacterium]
MKHLVAFPLESGGSIVIEVDEPEVGGTVRAARGEKLDQAKETVEEALNKILPVTKNVVEKIRDVAHKPEEIEITFGVKLTTTAGAVIASASAEANFEIRMLWTDKKSDQH